jgi:hypothetical protein
MTLALIDEAVAAGARFSRACTVLQLSPRTVQRWREQGLEGGCYRRRGPLTPPHNKLSETERKRVLKVLNSEPYRDLSVMKGSSMLSTMQWLGIVPSFSRPNVSDDNPFVEALFRTLKYRPGYASQRFATLEQATHWVARFVRWYNHEHLHSGIGFVTPHDRHTGADVALLAKRRAVYTKAHERHPERWTRNVRSWQRPRVVRLQPDREAIAIRPRGGCASA